jgi:hypothetical protein
LYWVEAITRYRPRAYRFLLTDRDPASLQDVVPYDPEKMDGPVKKMGGNWYWNPNFSSEFMIEADLSLDLCYSLNFVNHHSDICRLYGAACTERQQLAMFAGAAILGYLLGTGDTRLNHALLPKNGMPNAFSLRMAASGLWFALVGRGTTLKGKITGLSEAKQILKAASLEYAVGGADEARDLVAWLASNDIFETACCELIKEHFGLASFQID